jgi:hypothetical protein
VNIKKKKEKERTAHPHVTPWSHFLCANPKEKIQKE